MELTGKDLYTHSPESEQVEIPTTSSPLTVQQTAELTRAINPMEPCQDLGVELYLATRAFVNACIYINHYYYINSYSCV